MNVQRIELNNSTIMIRKGNLPGKTVLVMAGVHGNERCGIETCNRFLQSVSIERGTLIVIYANNAAIKKNVRQVEYNLNRCFLVPQPKDMMQSLEGKTARELMPYLDKADALLDLHASYTPRSPPFVICDERNAVLAKKLPVSIVLVNIDPFHPGSTDAYMNLQNKPAFCMECGYLGDPTTINRAVHTLQCFLVQQGAIFGSISQNRQRVYKTQSIYRNRIAPFKKAKFFADFEKLPETTIIGYEGRDAVKGEAGNVLLFVRNAQSLNEECFLVAHEVVS